MRGGGGGVFLSHSGESGTGVELGLFLVFRFLYGYVPEIVRLGGGGDVLRDGFIGGFAALDYLHGLFEVDVFPFGLPAGDGLDGDFNVFFKVQEERVLLRRGVQVLEPAERHESERTGVQHDGEERPYEYGVAFPSCHFPLIRFHSGCVARITL